MIRRSILLVAATFLAFGATIALTAPAGAAAPGAKSWQPPVIFKKPVPCTSSPCYSLNWAGYAAAGPSGTLNHVAATWSVPTIASTNCASGDYSWSANWVGLDGWTSRTVEQTGTETDCVNGTVTYSAWYEAYPKLPVTCSFTVHAGNTINASVDYSGGMFTVSLTDTSISAPNSCGTSFTLRRAKRSSAEVIVEAPASNGGPFGVLPLANFGTTSFTGATVNGAPLANSDPLESVMSSNGQLTGGTIEARPGSLSADAIGSSFTVTAYP